MKRRFHSWLGENTEREWVTVPDGRSEARSKEEKIQTAVKGTMLKKIKQIVTLKQVKKLKGQGSVKTARYLRCS